VPSGDRRYGGEQYGVKSSRFLTGGRQRVARSTAVSALALALVGSGLGAFATSAQDVGTLAERSFTSTQRIQIDDGGRGNPYPSSVRVQNMPGVVEDVRVRLLGVTHTNPDDLDVLLVDPDGNAIILMSDVGGTDNIDNVDITFDDAGAGPILNEGRIVKGTYQPSNSDGGDSDAFANAPSPSGTTLAAFDDADPNGNWKLYVRDDSTNDYSGSIAAGWSIRITTTNSAPIARPDRYEATEGERLKVGRADGVLANDRDVDNDRLTAQLDDRPRKGRISLKSNGSFTYTPKRGETGGDSFTYFAVDGDGRTSRAKVNIDIEPSRDRD